MKNISINDRNMRIVIGAVLLLLAALGIVGSLFKLLAIVIGVVLLVTAFIRFCPIYRIVGIRTSDE